MRAIEEARLIHSGGSEEERARLMEARKYNIVVGSF
jgi:hypothetical protein